MLLCFSFILQFPDLNPLPREAAYLSPNVKRWVRHKHYSLCANRLTTAHFGDIIIWKGFTSLVCKKTIGGYGGEDIDLSNAAR